MYKSTEIMRYMVEQVHQISTNGKKRGRTPRPERQPVTKKPTSIKLGEAARVAPGVLRYRYNTN
jgi:hypothetical protein